MSLSLTMMASNSEGLRSCFFDDVATASAIRPHCEGVQAGVCHRIFSFTAQIVCARQALAWGSTLGSTAELTLTGALTARTVGRPDGPAFASDGVKLASAVAVPRDNDSFRRSASTVTPPFDWSKRRKSTVSAVGAGPPRIPRRVQRFDPDQVQGKSLVKKNVGSMRR